MIEIERKADNLHRIVWRFHVLSSIGANKVELILSHFAEQCRETTRHKWKSVRHWDMHNRRLNSIDKPTLPLDVRAEAIRSVDISVRVIE